MYQSNIIVAVQNNELKIVFNLNKVVTVSETTCGTTASKVNFFLQISNVSVNVYSVSLLPQVNFLLMKFCGYYFKLTAKTTNNYTPENLYVATCTVAV